MLVLTRKQGEMIVIDGRIRVTVLDIRGGYMGARIRLGIEAPPECKILRQELCSSDDKVTRDEVTG